MKETLNSCLSRAVTVHQEHPDLDLSFEDLTDYFWEYNGDSVHYSDLAIDILDETGNAMCLAVCYKSDEDSNYIRFHVDNGCGSKYDVVFDKLKRIMLQ